jgi:hypothetical protein
MCGKDISYGNFSKEKSQRKFTLAFFNQITLTQVAGYEIFSDIAYETHERH